jgi:hypothetical protein
MIEGSGSITLTNVSGFGSGKPKNMWIRWIRIRSTATRIRIWIRMELLDPDPGETNADPRPSLNF